MQQPAVAVRFLTLTRFAGVALFLLTSLSLSPSTSADDNVIKQRQQAFSELKKTLKGAAHRLDETSPDWAGLTTDADKARSLVQVLRSAFPAGSADGSRARTRIWDNWPEFSSRLNRMGDALDSLATASANQDREQALHQLDTATSTCSGCHMRYRSIFSW